MKSARCILTLLLTVILTVNTAFAANTILLRHGGTNTPEPTLAAAVAAAVEGDTVDITAYDTPIDGGGGFQLVGVNLICSATGPAVINFTVAPSPDVYDGITYILTQGAVTLSNINFVGSNLASPSSGCGYGVVAFDEITIDKCSFRKFIITGLFLVNVDSFDPASWGYSSKSFTSTTLNAHITNTYVADCSQAAIRISSLAVQDPPQTIYPATIQLDHCTLAAVGGTNVLWFDTTYLDGEPTHDFTPVTMTNTILYTRNVMSPVLVQDFTAGYSGSCMAAVGWTEHHNAFLNCGTPLFDYQVDTATGKQPPVVASDIYQTPLAAPFRHASVGDYSLATDSPALGAGVGGTNIGAYQGAATGAAIVEPDVIVRQDGANGTFTDLTAAVLACPDGGWIDIQQLNGDGATSFTIPVADIGLDLGSRKLSCSVPGKKAIVSWGGGFWQMAISTTGGTLENIMIVGTGPAAGAFGLRGYGNVTVKDCVFANLGTGIHDWDTDPTGLSGSITGCYIINCDKGISIDAWWPASYDLTPADYGPFLIDHNTILCTRRPFVIEANYAQGNEPPACITLTNNVLSMTDYSWCLPIEQDGTFPTLRLNHSYNAYVGFGEIWLNNGGSDLSLDTGEMKIANPKFTNPVGNDYSPTPDSILNGNGEDGSTIGAYQTSYPRVGVLTLTYTAGAGGSIGGISPQMLTYGDSGTTVTAVAATNYYFIHWSDGSTLNPRTDANVTTNITVMASFASTIATAATIVVTHDGVNTTYTDMPTAEAAFVAGDTMDIQDFNGALPWAGNCPPWTTVKCSKPGAQALLLVDPGNGVNNTFGILDHMTLQNLIIDGQTSGGNHNGCAVAFTGGTSSSVINCTIKGFWWNTIFIANGSMTNGVQDPGVTFSNCYIESTGNCIGFSDSWVTGPATITNKVSIDHCTLVSLNGGPPIEVDANNAGLDIREIFSLRNSILSNRQGAVGIFYDGVDLTDAATQVDEDFNFFDAWWSPIYSPSALIYLPVGLHSIKYDYRDISASNPDYFADYAGGVYTLMPGPDNPCVKAGEDGTNIGVDQSLTAVTTHTLTYTAGADGSIMGATAQTVNYGASGTAVTAMPDAGYHFVNWSDGSTANPRMDTNVIDSITVTANFANTYTLIYIAGTGGSISGLSLQTVAYGASGTTVTAVPATDYDFINWSDGSTLNPRTDTDVTANVTVMANFARHILVTAATIVVTHDGVNTTYTDMPTAEGAFVAGDTMDIQDFDGPLPWAGNCPPWTTVKCSKPGARAMLLVDTGNGGNNRFGYLDHLTLQNLIIDGQSTGGNHDGCALGIKGGTSSSVINCAIKGFWWNAILITYGSMTNGVQDPGVTISNCYIESYGTCIDFDDLYVTAPATITNKASIDHCTLVALNGGIPIFVESSFAGINFRGIFALRNSILSNRQGAVGIVYTNAILTNAAIQVDEDYNLFDAWWNPLYSQGGPDSVQSGPVGPHSIKYDYRTISASNPDYFADYANGDYTLMPGPDNPCVKAGEDGTDIGVDQSVDTFKTRTLTYTAGAGGSITGATPQTVTYGASGAAVTAVPDVGYYFVNWSDGSTANPRMDTNVTTNIIVTANFANTYTLTYTAGTGGSISGLSPQTVTYGASGTTVTAVPATNYTFINWSDGSTVNPRTDTHVTASLTVTANFARTIATATTIVVTHNGTNTIYNDMPMAEAALAPGDTMDIHDFNGPLPWAGNCPSWTTVKCSNPGAQATLLVNTGNGGNNLFGNLDHLTLQNLIIDGQSTGGNHDGCAAALKGGTSSSVINCTIKGFWWDAILILNGSMTNGVQDPGVTISNCYIESYGTCIDFNDSWITAPATITNKASIDHCTLVALNGGFPIYVGSSFAGRNFRGIFSLRNSIISNRQGAVGIVYSNAILTNAAIQVDEDYNLFDAWWNPLYSQGGPDSAQSGPVGPHSIKYDYRNISASNPDFFADYANGVYTLMPEPKNPCFKKGMDGTNIGADQSPIALTTHTLTYTAGAGGSITGATPQTVNSGASGTAVTAVPDVGYHFVNWSDGWTINPRIDTNVTTDITVTADFTNTYTLTYTALIEDDFSTPSAGPMPVNPSIAGQGSAIPTGGYWRINTTSGTLPNYFDGEGNLLMPMAGPRNQTLDSSFLNRWLNPSDYAFVCVAAMPADGEESLGFSANASWSSDSGAAARQRVFKLINGHIHFADFTFGQGNECNTGKSYTPNTPLGLMITANSKGAIRLWMNDNADHRPGYGGWVDITPASAPADLLQFTFGAQQIGVDCVQAGSGSFKLDYLALIYQPDPVGTIPTTPPLIIGSPAAVSISDTQATIQWQTDKPADSLVYFGASSVGECFASDSQLLLSHAVRLVGLQPSTTYHVQVSSTDGCGNGPTLSAPFTFQTAATPDTTAPVFEQPATVVSPSDQSAIIQWKTDEPATSLVQYGTDNSLGQSVTVAGLAQSHAVQLTGLTPFTRYYFQACSQDGAGNGPTSSQILSFMTLPEADSIPPAITGGPLIVSISQTGAAISWTTNEPSTSEVSCRSAGGYLSCIDNRLVLNHMVQLAGLDAATTYTYSVASIDAAGNGPTHSIDRTFTTLASPDLTPPAITTGPLIQGTTNNAISVYWVTNKPANSVVDYGLTSNSLTQRLTDVGCALEHHEQIVNLQANTQYYLRVSSTDMNGNGPTSSTLIEASTHLAPDTTPPVILDGPRVIDQTDVTVTLYWQTDEMSNSVVHYGTDALLANTYVDPTLVKEHEVTLSGLTPGTAYDYNVSSTDAAGNTVTAAGTSAEAASLSLAFAAGSGFVTHLIPDTTPPVITEAPTIAYLTNNSAIVSWKTDKISDAQVSYAVSGQPLNNSAGQLFFQTDHLITLANLTPNTPYVYRVASRDVAGNGPTVSQELNFETLANPDVQPPQITQGPTAARASHSREQIIWTTDKLSTSEVFFGRSANELGSVASIDNLSIAHALTLTGLTSGTYYYVVVSRDSAGNEQRHAPQSFSLGGGVNALHSDWTSYE